jgi:hypothetical protein
LRIDEESINGLTHWLASALDVQEGDRQLILAFVESLRDGSWRDRWSRVRDAAPAYGSEQHVLTLRDGLRLVIVLDYNGVPGAVQVRIMQ